LRALAEASLDFDTAETGHVNTTELEGLAENLQRELGEAMLWEERREPSRGRPRILLAGRPNAGKSSLFNRLTGAEQSGSVGAALVSSLAGSTRDGVAGLWRVFGVDVEIMDAPGLDDLASASSADGRAQELAERERRGADLLLWLVDVEGLAQGQVPSLLEDKARLQSVRGAGEEVLCIFTKLDLGSPDMERHAHTLQMKPGMYLGISSKSGAGIQELEGAVGQWLGLTRSMESQGQETIIRAAALGRELSARHRAAIGAALAAVGSALDSLQAGFPLDLVAETLREGTLELDAITGETTPEDLLDRIFSGFCLGK